ncbi:hypothetical protein C0Q70_06602 [Pomacea canaliculata]|uniref:DNA oxidative demethylase ALKBH2 n=1 Tax=Pomacea canaliculata TaxID=400727 RepID=A0A2T7PCR1_POMCA|nr:hypothetical protein C0Q70_06602 [Pomacea canaliculata]
METFVLKSGGKRRYEASGGEADTSKDRTHEAATEHRPKKKQLASCRTAPTLHWTKIAGENLDCDYVKLYSKKEADDIFLACERSLIYNSGHLAKVQLFGKWVDIPRKQVAYGNDGLTYKFSGNTVPAKPWLHFLTDIRDHITNITGFDFNFVLINRYKDGFDYIGEHKDDEKDLMKGCPIASLSLGQPRDFIFRHQDSRGKNACRKIEPVNIELEHGSLLLMNHPTNQFWYGEKDVGDI